MKVPLFLFLAFASSQLCAQRTDTTEVKNGMYGVFKRDSYGNPQNPVVIHDTTGRLICHQSYRDGLLHGQFIEFDSFGREARSTSYRNGKLHGPEVFYYTDGKVRMFGQKRRGINHGPSITYHPNGSVEWTRAYRNGKLHGERILRDSTGAFYNGENVSYYPMSNGYYTSYCVNGRPHGKWVAKHMNGQVIITGNYTDGFPDGEFIYFAPDGIEWGKDYYKMGKFVRSTRSGHEDSLMPDQKALPRPAGR